MALMIMGAFIGSFWGWQYACVGASAGIFLSGLTSQLSGSEENEGLYQFEDIPTSSNDFSIDDHAMHMTDITSSTDFMEDSYGNDLSINPANGLPMVGAIDVEGNPFGTDMSHDMHGSCFDNTFDTGIDDSSGCGFSDSY